MVDQLMLRGVVASPIQMIELAEINAPTLVKRINDYERSLYRYVPVLRNANCHPAFLVVGIVCINDFSDLLFDCLSGRGRSSLRSARALFEHLLNIHALETDDDGDRFMCHSIVGTRSIAAWNPIEPFVHGKDRKALKHRQMKMLRDVQPELDEAIAEYGSSFVRQWHPGSLADRARCAGLETEYNFFRASSAAVHGAASAMEGSFWVDGEEPTVRVGPSVIACPASLAAGIRFFSEFTAILETRVDLGKHSLTGRVNAIGDELIDFCRYTNGLEEHLFSEDRLPRPSRRPVAFSMRRHRQDLGD